MLETIKSVSNPLTIIAIFAALAEVAGTVAIKLIDASAQGTFIWFVMLFPVLLVLLFFLTLNFNPRVLYAPSDFQNEENFLNVIGSVNHVSVSLDEVLHQLEKAKTQIIDDAIKQIGTVSEQERGRLIQVVNSRIEAIQQRVETTRESAESVAVNSFLLSHPAVDIQTKLLTVLSSEAHPMSTSEIRNRLGEPYSTRDSFYVRRALRRMTDKGLLIMHRADDKEVSYELNRLGDIATQD